MPGNRNDVSLGSNQTLKDSRYILSPALLMTQSQPYLNIDQVSYAVETELREGQGNQSEYAPDYSFDGGLQNPDQSTLDQSKLFQLQKEKEDLLKQQKESLWAFLGVIVLLSAIIGGSSIGTISNFIPPTNSLVLNSWRYGILVMYMAIPTAIETMIQWKHFNFKSMFTPYNYAFLITTQLV